MSAQHSELNASQAKLELRGFTCHEFSPWSARIFCFHESCAVPSVQRHAAVPMCPWRICARLCGVCVLSVFVSLVAGTELQPLKKGSLTFHTVPETSMEDWSELSAHLTHLCHLCAGGLCGTISETAVELEGPHVSAIC